MNAKTWRLIHKWSAIIVGIMIVIWTFSGIIMILPMEWTGSKPLSQSADISFNGADIPPSLAAKRLGITNGERLAIQEIGFKKILGELFYQVILDDGSSHLINVRTGKIFRITSSIAEDIVRAATGITTKLASNERIQEHDLRYPYGPLPAYRIIFEDNLQNSYYVSGLDGSVAKSTGLSRLRSAIVSLHSFGPITTILDQEQMRIILLVFFSLISVLAALTGYYLVVLPMIRKSGKSKGNPLEASERVKGVE